MSRLLSYDQTYYIYQITRGTTSVIGLLGCLDVTTTKFFEHEHAVIDKVYKYMQELSTTATQETPVTVVIKAENEYSLLRTLMLHAKKNRAPLLESTSNGSKHAIWEIEKTYANTIAHLLSKEKFYVMDGHHRYNAIKMNSMLGGHGKMLSWIITSSDCCFDQVHRIITTQGAAEQEHFLKELALDSMLASKEQCLAALEQGNFGMYYDGYWYVLKHTNKSIVDRILTVDALTTKYFKNGVEYCTTLQQLDMQNTHKSSLALLFPKFCFKDLEELTKMRRLLPSFSTFMTFRPCEKLLAYKYNLTPTVCNITAWPLDKVS